ncbi:MAG: plastocyanin/azurin family copper-binding protein, partial [Candidatus Nitrosomaritimum yanchengensis]
MTKILKPIGTIIALASVTGIVTFVAFGFVSPDTYILADEVEEEIEEEITGPIFPITILKNSGVQGNPDYKPDVAYVPLGYVVEWINEDTIAHTVTSSEDVGETFDSGLINEGENYRLDTSELELGEYEYFCIVHPWMKSKLVIEKPKEPATVSIPDGAGIQKQGQIYYEPEVLHITSGTPVIWSNDDSVAHTVTSGTAQSGPTGLFDSGMIMAGETFEYAFILAGNIDYYCVVHPWMVGTVEVG